MKLLCNQPMHVHGLDGLFPSIAQDYYNAYNIEDQESDPDTAHPIKCNSRSILKAVYLWNQQSELSEPPSQSYRNKREVALQKTDNPTPASSAVHTDIISNEEKQRILTRLHVYMQSAHKISVSNLFLPQEKEAIREIVMEQGLETIYQAIKGVRAATTREKVAQLLRTLNAQITTLIRSIQNVLLPPLAKNFESQTVSIWIETNFLLEELSELGLEQASSQTFRNKSLNYLQTVISDIERFKSLNTGYLSAEFIRRLQNAFGERKNSLVQARHQIAGIRNNKDFHATLTNLRQTIARNARKEKLSPILSSPQLHYLRNSRVIRIPIELCEMESQLSPTI